jgi:glycosyltransferase involved in cell wall biosynthesis
MISVIIPSRQEKFLDNTIRDVLKKAVGEVEVIPILDGYDTPRIEDSRVHYIHFPDRKGMRAGINEGVALSKGEYIMKSDAHCMYELGFDEKLRADCDDDWVVVPRRHRLDGFTWELQPSRKPPFDYGYFDTPFRPERFMGNPSWLEKDRIPELKSIPIDDTMGFQGSCWYCKKSHLLRIGDFDTEHYWGWEQEPQELCFKTWLIGGLVKVNKKVWYAHLHKGNTWGRMYYMNKEAINRGHRYSADYWVNNRWEKQTRKFEWVIDHFWPIPSWKEGWREDKLENYA